MDKLLDYIDKGGVIMEILLVLNVLGISLIIWKAIQIAIAYYNREKIVEAILSEVNSNGELISDEVSLRLLSLERGLETVKIIASISPLLGLLGTVIGVLFSFEAISKSGLDDPSLFAEGISLALITTVGGLIVAIPNYIGYNYLISALDRVEISLNKLSRERLK
jgi:biopolymer transport protein ExbB